MFQMIRALSPSHGLKNHMDASEVRVDEPLQPGCLSGVQWPHCLLNGRFFRRVFAVGEASPMVESPQGNGLARACLIQALAKPDYAPASTSSVLLTVA